MEHCSFGVGFYYLGKEEIIIIEITITNSIDVINVQMNKTVLGNNMVFVDKWQPI